MNKVLVICGPTATGKTKLGLSLAKKFNGEILSADSRQVYKNLDIGTGKDISKRSKFVFINAEVGGYYVINDIKIWGYDLIDPRCEFSVSHYVKYAKKIIARILNAGKLPILVGGTGLYIKGVIDGIETVSIPQNKKLRLSLLKNTADELFEILRVQNPIKSASMNSSDSKNSRRLIRAIEIEKNRKRANNFYKPNFDPLWLGLKLSKTELRKRISKRVEERLEKGVFQEVEKLIKSGISQESQAMTSLGYRQISKYLNNIRSTNISELKLEWLREEEKYARKQMIWFTRNKRISWFDPNVNRMDIERLVDIWYHS